MKAEVTIEGVVPLLMHRYPTEKEKEPKRKGEVPLPEQECESALYKDEGRIYVPSSWVEAMLVQAGSRYTMTGRRTYREVMKTIIAEPERIPLINRRTGERYRTYDDPS